MTNPWDGIIPQETLDHYRRAGFAKQSRAGTSPALLVIDTQYLTAGEESMPLEKAVEYHPLNCGEYAWRAIANMVPLIAAFRAARAPVIYPYVSEPKVASEQSRWPTKTSNARFYDMIDAIAPEDGDILLPKTAPSAFFGTPLIKYLNTLRVDTVFLTGNTTSGCIRATAVDASSYDYNVIVAHDSCYDRSPVSHAVNLFDMESKYADVVSTEAAIDRLASMKVAARGRKSDER